MNEVEYVVPPESSGAPKVPNNQQEPPKKPGKLLAWINSNRTLSVAGLVMAIIIVLAGTAMITGQKISIFGLQLNPMYQQANCPADFTGEDISGCGGLWDQPSDETDKITITGSFSEGKAGALYTKQLQVSSSTALPCEWTLVGVKPEISDASLKSTNNTSETSDVKVSSAVFTATPKEAGDYEVTVKVTCKNGQTTSKTFVWKVAPATATGLGISGNFSESLVGQPYSTNLQTINANGFNCTFELTDINPKVTGATVTRVDNVAATLETSALFSATPTESGTYTVKIGVSCVSGTDVLPVAVKDFSWVVKPTRQPPLPAPLDISGTFTEGKVGQESSFNLQTINSETSTCTWALDKITPSMSGAKVTGLDNIQSDRTGRATFTATPSAAGTYVVTISVQCGPQTGEKNMAKKDFTWKVTGGSTGGGGGSGGGGSSASNCSSNKDKLMPIYRFWKAADGDHFFTTNANERPGDYVYEGIAGYVYKEKVSGTTPIYRSYHSGVKAHYYSTTDDATNYGYANEGILGYGYTNNASGSLPWFRLHKGYPQSDYLETTSTKEKGEVLAMGYVDEGVVANICEKNN